jgi:hypothetical protein
MSASWALSGANTVALDTCRAMVEERAQQIRRTSPLRLLAAALAGAFGAFGVPGGAHVPKAPPAPAAATSNVSPQERTDA